MAVDADAVISFDQLVRIFVDTDVDTHFIVSIVRTSTVAELRELVKVTHRHCYPGKGDIDIGQLAVPGGEHGYHLADFLRIGQVYDKDEGKVFAEVKSCDPASSNRDGLLRMPALSFTNSLTPKKVPLLAPQPLVEPCAQLAVEPSRELKEPKLLKEEADGDVDCLLGSQEPLDRLPGIGNGLADSLEEPTDGKLLERLGAVLCDGRAENSAAPLVAKVSSLDQDMCVAEPDRISEGVTPALTFDIKGVSRKRDSSVSNERPSKSRRLTKAPSGSTSNVPEANGRLNVRSAALDWKEGDRLNPDGMLEDVNGLTGGSLSHMTRSGNLDSNLLSSSGRKRKKKKRVRNLDLTISENRNEAVKGENPGVEDKEKRCDAKTENEEDAGPAIGSGVVASGNVGLEVDRGRKSDSLPDGPGVSPALLPKKKAKKRREQKPEQKPERKLTKTRKKKKCETIPVVSASLNHVLNESDRGHEQENGQCTYVTSALVDPGHQLIAKATSPNRSQHVKNNEEVDNIALKDVEKKKTGRKLRKKGTSLSVDVSNQKGSQNSGRPSVLNLSRDEAAENEIPRGEAQVLNETSGEGTIRNGAELAKIDDKVLSPRMNLISDFNDAETSASLKGGSGASLPIQAAKVGSVESQESPNSSKDEGRGAPSETRHSVSSQDVTNGEGKNTKASEIQSFQVSEKAQQHSEGVNEVAEVSAAQIRPVRVKTSPSYSEANSGHVIASPGRVAHVSSESEPGHLDQFKVAKPDKVALSRTCTGESSAKSDPRSANQTEVGNQHDVSRKEDWIRRPLRMSPTPNSVRSPEEHASTSPKRTDGRETNLKFDSLEFFSQDQSFQVAPTQVAKALSDNTTEDNSDKSDTDQDEEIDEFKKQKTDNLGISDKVVGESDDSSDETGRRDDPPLTTRIPVPLVSGMTGSGGIKSSQIFKRRASGVTADIEAKFAHFIENQDGLDELMGINLGQRKRSMPIEPLTQAESLATAADSLLHLASNTQESVKNSSMTLPGRAVGLERYQAIDLAPASQISTGKLLTPQFKVPKPVTIEKISVAGLGAATALQSSGKEVPKTGVKALRLKRNDSIKQAEKERKSSLEKHNDASLLAIRESSKKTSMDDQEAAEEKQTPAGLYNLLYTPESLKETFRNDLNAATDRKTSVEKTSGERKRLEEQCQDSQFMIVNNTDHISEDRREEEELESNQETKGPSCVIEDAPNMTGKKRKGRKISESVETGLVESQEASEFDTGGKKKTRKTSETGEKKKKKRKLDIEEVTILRETSADRSARETEELYLKLEKSKRELWLQTSVLSLTKDAEKAQNRVSPAGNSDPIDAVEGGDVAQSKLEGGVAQIDGTDNNEVKVMSDTPVPGGIAADSKLSPDLCGGTSEASDREDGVFLSEGRGVIKLVWRFSKGCYADEKAGAAHQDKLQKDVFDFVSEDEAPMITVSKSAKKSGMKESKAQRLEDVASRAVQRVLEDDMLHVMDSTASVGKKPRKDAKPVKWTVRMRGSPVALATSLHGGTVPSDAIYHIQSVSSPHIVSKSTGNVDGGAQVELGLENSIKAPRARNATKVTKARAPKPKQSSGAEICPVGCGRLYASKTSAYYIHKKACTGAPTE